MIKKILTLQYASLVVLSFYLTGCGNETGKKQGSDPGSARGIPVDGLVIKKQPLDYSFTTTGTLLANEEVELRNEISGRITAIYFSEGGWVKKGERLVKIFDQDLQAQLKKNESQIELATDEEKRKKSLFDQQLASREEYDIALNKLKVLQAEREIVLAQIAKTEITAPFDGRLGLRSVSPGAFIPVNTFIASLQQTDPMKLEFMLPDRYQNFLKQGMNVNFQITGNDKTFSANVYAFETKIDPSTRTVKVRAKCANPGNILKPGTLAKIAITLEKIPDAVLIPGEALIPELNGQKVFLYTGGAIVSRKVQTGLRTENEIQITDGLQPGDTVITTGLLQVRDGSKVFLKSIR